MKKIKGKGGKPWCKWCPEKTVKAVWRTSGIALNKHVCEESNSSSSGAISESR